MNQSVLLLEFLGLMGGVYALITIYSAPYSPFILEYLKHIEKHPNEIVPELWTQPTPYIVTVVCIFCNILNCLGSLNFLSSRENQPAKGTKTFYGFLFFVNAYGFTLSLRCEDELNNGIGSLLFTLGAKFMLGFDFQFFKMCFAGLGILSFIIASMQAQENRSDSDKQEIDKNVQYPVYRTRTQKKIVS